MKPGRVKVVVAAATAVEGADVREGEAVTGAGVVVAEDAPKITPGIAATEDSGGCALCRHSSHRQKQLPVNFIGTAQCSAHLRPGLQIHDRTNNQAAHSGKIARTVVPLEPWRSSVPPNSATTAHRPGSRQSNGSRSRDWSARGLISSAASTGMLCGSRPYSGDDFTAPPATA